MGSRWRRRREKRISRQRLCGCGVPWYQYIVFCLWLRIIKKSKKDLDLCSYFDLVCFGLCMFLFYQILELLVWVRLIEWRGLDKNFVLIGFWLTRWSFVKVNFSSHCIFFCFFCRLGSFGCEVSLRLVLLLFLVVMFERFVSISHTHS